MIAALLAVLAIAQADVAVVRRFALVVGSNDGGHDRVRLRYANSDALSFSRVLSELGGVRDDDAMLLRDATATTLRGAIGRMKQKIAQLRTGDERLEFLLYYSGHSDEEGLLLAGDRLTYGELRTLVADMPVDVKIAILDSCASGALVRLKGGQQRQAFLVDASAKARGHAFITSSSADEASQESDRISGSFFTHFLVSGLRGAADTTGDKRVTLNEAYQFAFNETLQRTERTQSGAQHPSYDIQLQGSGDLVMTDVRSTRAGIVFDEPVDGRIFVRDQNDRLIVELNKARDRLVEIGLSAGEYTVTREASTVLSVAKVSVAEGQRISLDLRAFIAIQRERTASRGGPPQPDVVASDPPRVAFVFGFAGPLHSAMQRAPWPKAYFALSLFHGRLRDLDGISAAFGVTEVRHRARGIMTALGMNIADDRMEGIQVALGANWTGDWHRGVQASLGFNYADGLSGMQLSMVNVAHGMRGIQIGLINTASNVEGFQLGLINITKSMKGASLGLFSLVRDEPIRLQFYASDMHVFNLGVRYGSKYLYGILLGGLQPFDGKLVRGAYGLGLGVHIPFWHLFIDLDSSVQHLLVAPLYFRAPHFLWQQRLGLGGQILERFALIVGMTFNTTIVTGAPLTTEARDVSYLNPTVDGGAGGIRFWPGFYAGIQI